MGLDIIKDMETIALSHSEFNKLLPYLKIFYTKTGIEINEYTDLKLSPNHARLLHKLLSDDVDILCEDKKIIQLLAMLMDASDQTKWLILQGD